MKLSGSYTLDAGDRTCVVDASTDVGATIARVLTGFLGREFGDDGFVVDQVQDETIKEK